MHVDLEQGTLEFSKNNKTFGVAFCDVKGPLSPCISLIKGQRVDIVDINTVAPPLVTQPNEIN